MKTDIEDTLNILAEVVKPQAGINSKLIIDNL